MKSENNESTFTKFCAVIQLFQIKEKEVGDVTS